MIKQALIVAGLVCLVLILAACGTAQQTTSEYDHLGRYAVQAAVVKGQAIDPVARRATLREPALRFPARIGLARIEKGVVSPLPQSEAEAWLAMVKELGPGWGEFVPISPLEVALAVPKSEARMGCPTNACDPSTIAATLRDIRRSAGRQRLDAVLVYEVLAENVRTSGALAITDLALVERFLSPGKSGNADGQAKVVLVDVRNGYIYGFAASVADAAESAGHDKPKTAVIELAEETGIMLRDLRIELAEARLDQAH